MITENEIIEILERYYSEMEQLDGHNWKNYIGKYNDINKKYAKAIIDKIKEKEKIGIKIGEQWIGDKQ